MDDSARGARAASRSAGPRHRRATLSRRRTLSTESWLSSLFSARTTSALRAPQSTFPTILNASSDPSRVAALPSASDMAPGRVSEWTRGGALTRNEKLSRAFLRVSSIDCEIWAPTDRAKRFVFGCRSSDINPESRSKCVTD